MWLEHQIIRLLTPKRCWLIETAKWLPWKSESAIECVTTHSLNEFALTMDGANACNLQQVIKKSFSLSDEKTGIVAISKGISRACMDLLIMHILMLVAKIQSRTSTGEARKCFTRIMIEFEWVVSKPCDSSYLPEWRKRTDILPFGCGTVTHSWSYEAGFDTGQICHLFLTIPKLALRGIRTSRKHVLSGTVPGFFLLDMISRDTGKTVK